MADNIGDLILTIRVNKETGNIEIAKGELNSLGDAATQASAKTDNLGKAFDFLGSKLAGVASAAAVVAFLKQAVTESMEYDESLRHLAAQLDALKIGFTQNKQAIIDWAQSMQATARMEDNVFFASMSRAVQKTGDLKQSLQLVKLAQDISVATGNDYNGMLERLIMVAGGGFGAQRALMMLNREFGQQVAGAKNAQEVVDRLQNTYGGWAEKVDTLTTSFQKNRLSFADNLKEIGKNFTPTFKTIFDYISTGFNQVFKELIIKASAAGAILNAVVTMHFKVIPDIVKRANKEIDDIYEEQKTSLIQKEKIKIKDSKKNLAEQVEAHKEAMAEIDRQEELALLSHKSSTSKMIEDYKHYRQERVNEVARAEKAGTLSKEEANKERAKIDYDYQKKSKREEERGQKSEEVILQDWVRSHKSASAETMQIAVGAFDGMANAFGQSTAKMIMQGKDFAETFEALVKNLVEQVIEQFVAMAVRLAIIKTMGNSFFGVPTMALMGSANGNRATKPTLTVFGEGGEGETVVPDSGARAFAHGVMAGQASKGGGGGGMPSAGNVHIAQNINVSLHVSTLDAKDRAVVLDALTKEMRSRTKAAISFAVKASDVAGQNTGRAV